MQNTPTGRAETGQCHDTLDSKRADMSWIARVQQRLSDRVHAPGDAFAWRAGWTTTTTTGPYGFGARAYRDARFDQQRPAGVTGERRGSQAVASDGPVTVVSEPQMATTATGSAPAVTVPPSLPGTSCSQRDTRLAACRPYPQGAPPARQARHE